MSDPRIETILQRLSKENKEAGKILKTQYAIGIKNIIEQLVRSTNTDPDEILLEKLANLDSFPVVAQAAGQALENRIAARPVQNDILRELLSPMVISFQLACIPGLSDPEKLYVDIRSIVTQVCSRPPVAPTNPSNPSPMSGL